jgi:integrase/recombinase XerD
MVLIDMKNNIIEGCQIMRNSGKSSILAESDLKRVIHYQKSTKHGLRNICLLHLSFYLGLRSKEMAGLSVKDVLFPDGQIRDEVLLTREMTKGSKLRTVFLTNPKVRSILKEYLNNRKQNDDFFEMDSPLFRSQKNIRFNPQTLSVVFRKMYDSVGLKGCSSHSGRRTFATSLLNQGVNIKNVQVLLGHSSITTTSIYLETNPKMLGDISKNLKI